MILYPFRVEPWQVVAWAHLRADHDRTGDEKWTGPRHGRDMRPGAAATKSLSKSF